MPDGIVVGCAVGDDVPAKPGRLCPLAGLSAALAELVPPLLHPASATVPAAAAAPAAAHQRRFQRR